MHISRIIADTIRHVMSDLMHLRHWIEPYEYGLRVVKCVDGNGILTELNRARRDSRIDAASHLHAIEIMLDQLHQLVLDHESTQHTWPTLHIQRLRIPTAAAHSKGWNYSYVLFQRRAQVLLDLLCHYTWNVDVHSKLSYRRTLAPRHGRDSRTILSITWSLPWAFCSIHQCASTMRKKLRNFRKHIEQLQDELENFEYSMLRLKFKNPNARAKLAWARVKLALRLWKYGHQLCESKYGPMYAPESTRVFKLRANYLKWINAHVWQQIPEREAAEGWVAAQELGGEIKRERMVAEARIANVAGEMDRGEKGMAANVGGVEEKGTVANTSGKLFC